MNSFTSTVDFTAAGAASLIASMARNRQDGAANQPLATPVPVTAGADTNIVPPPTPQSDLKAYPWPDVISRAQLDKLSGDFAIVSTGATSQALHKKSGDRMARDGFGQHTAEYYGEVTLEWLVPASEGVPAARMQKTVPIGDWWLGHKWPGRRVVRRTTMEPTNDPERTGDARFGYQYRDPEVLNLWYVYKEDMATPAEGVTLDDPRVQIFINQLRRFCGFAPDCDRTVMFFLAAYAWIYQHPEVRLPWFTVMYSEYGGTGKSKLFKLFMRVFGADLVSSCTGEDLNEKFTELTDHKRVVFVHEMPQSASRSAIGYERFKSRTTEEYVASRQMRIGSKQVRNFTHYVISTNNLDCLPLAQGDRRALVMVDHGQPLTLAERVAWENFCSGEEGPELVAGLFANWQHPDHYNPFDDVPQTAGALEMQQESRNPLVALLAECFAEGKDFFAKDIGRAQDICAQLGTLYSTATRGLDLTPSSVSRAARKAGAVQVGSPTNASRRALCWRRQTYWQGKKPEVVYSYLMENTVPDDLPKVEGVDHE